MNKSYIIFILIISLNFNANSQDFTKIDSLKNLLKTSNKEEKAKILNSLAFRYHTIDYNIGLEYAKQSLKISNELKNNKLIILAYNVLVTNYWAKSELDSAMLFAKKALELSYVLKDSAFISDAYFNIALINSSESKYNIAIKYYDTSYNYVPDKNLFSKISIEINRGVSNYNLTNYKEALKSFLIATKYYEANKFKENLPYTYDLLGNIYIATGEKELGLDYLKKALKISRELKYIVSEGTALQSIASYYETKEIYDSSLIYLKQALVLSIKTGHNIMTIDIYASIGDSYIKRGQIDSAKFYYNTVLDLAEKNDDNWAKVSGYKGIADVFLKQKKYRKAIKNYEKAEVIALQINSKEVLKDIYENLAKAYKAANKFKNACLIQEKYIKIADSLYNEESAKQLSNMKIIYETDKKEQENAKLKVENKLNEKTIENQKILNIAILIVFILSAILIVALILYSRKIKNTNSRLLYKNEQIHQQKEEITIQSENL
ncbi:MAG: hypothetical protein JXR51_03755 [Bacteroidales bacterium]|nr:hypothetical protein [Bacteroidales bacterium]